MRFEFNARQDARPLERLVDGFIFLSGGIFVFVDSLALMADEHGFGGIRPEVVARELLDEAVAPLAARYDDAELERAAAILKAAMESIGRRFYPDHYDAGAVPGPPPGTRLH